MKIYTYKNCDTCRKATKWLKSQDVEFEEVPIRETPPSKAELKRMLGYLGGDIRKLFNISGQDYRAMNLKETLPELSEAQAISLLSENGNLVKRPFVLTAASGTVGFREDEWKNIDFG